MFSKKKQMSVWRRFNYKFTLKFFLVNALVLFLIYEYNEYKLSKRINSVQFYYGNFEKINLNAHCKCRSNVFIEQHSMFDTFYKKDDYYFLFESDPYNKTLNVINKHRILQNKRFFLNPRFTCDLNHVFTHGPNRRVLSFSLYGQRAGYTSLIEKIVKRARISYPSWIVRIYYDNSINKSIICDLECRYDSVYFCNVNEIPFRHHTNINLFQIDNENIRTVVASNNLTYVHGMMW